MTIAKAYLGVLGQLLLNSLAKLLSFRLNFILFLFSELAAFGTLYLTVDFLYQHIATVGGWNRVQFMVFIFWWQCVMNLHSAFAAPNFWNFASELQNGNLDFRLLRPLGSLFDIFTAITRPISLVMLPLNAAFLVHYGAQIPFSVFDWLAIVPLLLLSFSLTILIELLIAMSMFWTTGGDGVNFIRIQCQQISKWPDFVYPRIFRTVFTLGIPVLATSTFCVRALFHDGAWWEVPFLVVACIALWCGIARLWRLGLQRYESASS
jgi:ABC-2 type transport system permease protein